MTDYKFPKEVEEVLGILKNTKFIITGSYALDMRGLLDRNPKDLDIISDDPLVLHRLYKNCISMDNVHECIPQRRFMYVKNNVELYVDVFPGAPKEFDRIGKFNVVKVRDLFINKLTSYYDLNKSKKDLLCYFNKLL